MTAMHGTPSKLVMQRAAEPTLCRDLAPPATKSYAAPFLGKERRYGVGGGVRRDPWRRPVTRLATSKDRIYDRIDKWLLKEYQLAPLDRGRVREAVFAGRQLDDPALARAAHQLASEVLRGRLGGLRLVRVMGGVFLVGPVGFAAGGIGGLVVSHDPWYALDIVFSAFLTVPAVMYIRLLQKARRQVGLALELNEDAPHPLGDSSREET